LPRQWAKSLMARITLMAILATGHSGCNWTKRVNSQ
jgi:hypothetical protein